MQDKEIVELFLERDETAIRETERKYERYLTKIAFNILKDFEDSRESVNDTYLRAWNSIPPQKPLILSAYLAKITRRTAIDIFRRKNRAKRAPSEYALSLEELEDCVQSETSVEEEIDIKLLGQAINEFLKTLPEETRNAFIGRYYFLDSMKEVAAYCGMSEGKLKSLMFRTRNELKEYLIKEGFDL